MSLTSPGAQVPTGAFAPQISSDGQHVSFMSTDPSLTVPGSGDLQVIVRDLAAPGMTEQVSVDSSGRPGDRRSSGGALSRDGHLVAFVSYATLSPADLNGFVSDVYVRDRTAQTTELVSLATDGTQGNGYSGEGGGAISDVSISADGRWVAFASQASNLVAGDSNIVADVFLRDRLNNTTERVSVATDGSQANGASAWVTISADGTTVSFTSTATNLVPGDTNGVADAFVHNRVTGVTERVSVGTSGSEANSWTAFPVALSANGSVAAFISDASNLVAGDTNAVWDVFVRDRSAGTTERVSVATSGAQGTDYSDGVAINGDGTIVVIGTRSSLVPNPTDTNPYWDTYVRNRRDGTTDLVSRTPSGVAGNSDSGVYLNGLGVGVDGSGTTITFHSWASDLVAGDTNSAVDIFVASLRPTKASQTITFGPIANATMADSPLTITPTASSGLAVTLTAATSDCTVNGTQVTLVRAGTCTLTASQTGDATYDPAPSVTQSFTVTPTAFVGRVGRQLVLSARPYRPIGLDIYNANSNGWCWYPLAGTVLDDSLTAIGPGKNVLRAWFFQQLATTNGVRDWTAFDRTLATARAHGYTVIATLVDQWGDCGVSTTPGFGYKGVSWYSTGYQQPDPAATVSYRDWAQEVAARYESDPTVLAWQLVNEPEVGNCGAVPEATATSLLKSFATDVSGAIKAVDPNHLVSLGTIGSGQCGAQGDDYQGVMSVPSLDLCEYHDYNPNQLVPGDQWNGLQRRIDQCNALNKPLIVGELGIRPNDVAGSFADRAKVVSDKLCAQLTAGVAGVLLWNWDKDASLLNNYDIGPSDPVLDALTPWSDPSHTCAPFAEPSAPRHVIAAAGPEQASVSWIAPASSGGDTITGYTVTPHPFGLPKTVGGTTTSTSLDLADGTAYTFTVTATNRAGPGGSSAASDPVTPLANASVPTTVAEVVSPQGTVTTDPGGGPTSSAPVTAAVQVPAGGSVTIAVSAATGSPPTGFRFLGQQVVINAPSGTPAVPLTLRFTLEGALVTAPLSQIEVIRTEGGVEQPPLGDCGGTVTATPTDPCVSDRSLAASGGGDVVITVLTSSASTWNLAVDTAAPVVTIDRVSRPFIGATGASSVIWHANENGAYSFRLGGADCSSGTTLASGSYWTAPSMIAVPVQATALALGSNTIRVCATDAALNTGFITTTIVKDIIAPMVKSIALAGPSPTNAPSVSWTVTFSEPVIGVGAANFTLLPVGVGGSPAITGVTGSGTTWTVIASSGTGDWLLQVTLTNRTGIADLASNPLANTLLGKIYQIDRVAPTITLTKPASAAVYTLGSPAIANFACADELVGSGVASCIGTSANGAPIDTASVGSKTFTVVALDRAGNSATKVVSYSIVYNFSGFFGSVANPPTLNSAKAGTGVAAAFSLAGNRDLTILATGSPTYQTINCTTHALIGSSSPAAGALAYSASTGRYTYTWQTNAAWANTCAQLAIVLNDGTNHLAWFKFAK